jgi:hypothetical protein
VNIQSDLKKLLAGSRKAATSVSEGLQELRMRRLRLLDERDATAARPVPQADALAALDRDIDELVATAKREINVRSLTRAENPAWTIPQNGMLIALLIGANREAFRSQLAEMIAPAYADAKPIEAAEREATLRRIDDELLDLEMAEEAAIRGAEASGLSILRRADADPRAVLLADKDLI